MRFKASNYIVLPPSKFQEWNLGFQDWQQEPLLLVPYLQSFLFVLLGCGWVSVRSPSLFDTHDIAQACVYLTVILLPQASNSKMIGVYHHSWL